MNGEYVVGDLMTIDPVVIGATAPIEDAERLLETYEISGLPVVDEGGSIVGVISQTDLLRHVPDGRQVRSRHPHLRVGELMTSPAITVDFLTPLVDAAQLMRDEHVHRVVVVSESGHAVGVLTSMDFVSLYADD
jgi:CBS domain-containing protein